MKLDLISHLVEGSNVEKPLSLSVMVGISGSGKSTYINRIKKDNELVISPDEIRKELTGNISDQSKNAEVFNIANKRLKESKSDTYFDATNLSMKSLKGVLDNAEQFNKINIIIMTASKNLDLCQRRVEEDISKGKDRSNVPEEVIENMHRKFIQFVQNLQQNAKDLKEEYGENRINIRMV